jgi:hypothetical protein
MTKIVSQLDHNGYYAGPVVADESPLEPGVHLIPGGSVDHEPPTVPEGQRARWNGSSFDIEDIPQPAVPPAPTFADLVFKKNADINVARAKANTGTFEHAGKTFSCDPLSRSDIDGVNGEVALTGALPQTFPGAWKAVDNTFLPIADVAAWTAFYRAMVAQGAANFAHAQQLKAQLAAATTAEEIAAIVW